MPAYLGLGTNLGDRAAQLRAALGRLRDAGRITGLSAVYETEAVGGGEQPPFYNLVARLETELDPAALLAATAAVEDALGRTRPYPNAPRTIDIDLLLYDDEVRHDPRLTLPHPRMLERAFVLRPLAELAPGLRHPVTGRTVAEHLRELDAGGVERLYPGDRLMTEAT